MAKSVQNNHPGGYRTEHLVVLVYLWLVVLLRLNLLLDVSKDLVLPPPFFGGLLDEGALAFLTSLG